MTIKRSAERELRRIDRPVVPRIVSAIHSLADEPRPAGCRKLVGSESEFRIRIGDYRVVYAIDDEAQEINVQRIRHRKDAYQ